MGRFLAWIYEYIKPFWKGFWGGCTAGSLLLFTRPPFLDTLAADIILKGLGAFGIALCTGFGNSVWSWFITEYKKRRKKYKDAKQKKQLKKKYNDKEQAA